MFTSKYGVARHIFINVPKAGSANHAVSADWIPAAGDVKISKDGGLAASVTNLPVAVAMGNSAIWDFLITATEMQAAQVNITVADSATKAVDDTGFVIETYGNASAQHEFDLDTASVAQTGDNYARLGAPAGASIAADLVVIDNFVDGLETTIGAAGAGLTALATQASVNAVDDFIDTEIADIQARLPAALVGGRIDASVGAVAANAITAAAIADGAIDRATFAADTGWVSVRSNTAQAGAATTITLDAAASAVTDFYKNALIVLTGGTGVGQGRRCTAYNGTTKVATVFAWATNPDVTTTFAIIAADAPTTSQVADEVQTRTIAAVTVVNGLAANVITAAATAADFTTEIQTGLATSANQSTIIGYIDTEVAAILAAVDTEVAAIKAKTDLIPAAPAAVGDIPTTAQVAAAVLTTQMTESYRAAGAAPTLAQAAFETIGHLGESAIVGTTKTVKKLDGTTAAKTYTLDSATVPTSITETT